MEQLLYEWLAIRSPTGDRNGLANMAQALKKSFSTLGPIEESDGVLHMRREGTPSVLLVGHYDIVASGAEVKQVGDRLYGPGAADMKGGLVVMLEALKRCGVLDRIGWEVFLTPDEEIGSPTSAPLLIAAAKRHTIGLVYEATLPDGALVSRRGASANYRLQVQGEAAHVGRDFASGKSAILEIARLIPKLWELNSSEITLNVGTIAGGVAANVVAPEATCLINVRATTDRAMHRAQQQLRALAEVQLLSERPAKPLTAETEALLEAIRACGKTLGLSVTWRETAGVCDGNLLASAGLPTVDTMGVRGGGMHTEDEYVELGSLTERAELSSLLLRGLAEGDL